MLVPSQPVPCRSKAGISKPPAATGPVLQTGQKVSHSHGSEVELGKAMASFSWHGRKSHDCFYQPLNILLEWKSRQTRNFATEDIVLKEHWYDPKVFPTLSFLPRSIQNIDIDPLPSTRFSSALWKPREDGASSLGWQPSRAGTPICLSLPWLTDPHLSFPTSLQKAPKDLLSHCWSKNTQLSNNLHKTGRKKTLSFSHVYESCACNTLCLWTQKSIINYTAIPTFWIQFPVSNWTEYFHSHNMNLCETETFLSHSDTL